MIGFSLSAQKIRITYETGYGMYSLSNLKDFQESHSSQINELPVSAVVRFPNYINHSATLCIYLDESNLLGINSAYLTSGGRNSLMDYSGEYIFDMILNGFQFGIESEHIRRFKNNFGLHLNFKLGLIKSELKYSESFKIYGVGESSSTDKLSQYDFFLEPNINFSKIIISGLAIKAGLGYNLNTSSFYRGMINWSGLRPNVGINYSF